MSDLVFAIENAWKDERDWYALTLSVGTGRIIVIEHRLNLVVKAGVPGFIPLSIRA